MRSNPTPRHAIALAMPCLLWLAGCQAPTPTTTSGTGTPQAQPEPASASVPASSATTAQGTPTPAAPQQAASPDGNDLEHWRCEELLVDATRDGEILHLTFSGRSLSLRHTESLVGTRYADAGGNAFSEQKGSAKLMLANGRQRDCMHRD